MNCNILAVDDEQDFLDSIRRGLLTAGFRNLHMEIDAQNAAALIAEKKTVFDVALIDITMPGMNGIELLEHIKHKTPDTQCIMVTAVNDAEVAVDCLKNGAYDYLLKPISKDDLIAVLHRALENKILNDLLNNQKNTSITKLRYPEAFKTIITRSANVWSVLKEAELHAVSDIPILITGESGTGKDLLARAIHAASPRAEFSFTSVNMASLPETLFDAAFHGHAKGAFTGAIKDRQGYLKQSHRGTLFMDEIGNIPLEFQAKLLRVLENGEFLQLGTDTSRKVNIRFLSATNMNLDALMAKGLFRHDFYYRLKGAWLHLPPLRNRRQDIPLLTYHFLNEFSGNKGKVTINEKVLSMLGEYNYPGNIRELKSILHAAFNLAQGGAITAACLPAHLQKVKSVKRNKDENVDHSILPLREVEKGHILKVYTSTDKNKSRTAKLLGIGLNTLRRKLQSYGVN